MATSPSLIEMLDQWETQMIADFSSSFEMLLRASCRWTHNAIVAPTKKEKLRLAWMLRTAAHSGHRDICVLAREWSQTLPVGEGCSGMSSCPRVLRELFPKAYEAPFDPSKAMPLVILDLNVMLCGAAENNHRDICILAREWAREMLSLPLNYDAMCQCAGMNGNHSLCELAREWGAKC